MQKKYLKDVHVITLNQSKKNKREQIQCESLINFSSNEVDLEILWSQNTISNSDNDDDVENNKEIQENSSNVLSENNSFCDRINVIDRKLLRSNETVWVDGNEVVSSAGK